MIDLVYAALRHAWSYWRSHLVQDTSRIPDGTFESVGIARTTCNEDPAGYATKFDQCDLVTAPRSDGDARASGAHDITDGICGFYSTVSHHCLVSGAA